MTGWPATSWWPLRAPGRVEVAPGRVRVLAGPHAVQADRSCLPGQQPAVRWGVAQRDVDLSRPLAADTVLDLDAALLTYRALFFRDEFLTHEEHIEFARNFGDLTRADPHQEPAEEQFLEILVLG